jgi:anthraniloyl-CoA monooxygenase
MRIAIVGGGAAGLYFALLTKKAWPDRRVAVYERNRSDDTFGFGVVFSDATLGHFEAYDKESYDAIRDQFAYWDAIDVVLHGETVRSYGHGFCGCGRMELLLILQRRCRELGVELHFESQIDDPRRFLDADLVVGADGVNSRVRETFKERFRPSFDWRRNTFCWLGSTKPYDAFTFDFTENEHGIWVLGAYQYSANMSTWVLEAPEETWASAKAELETMSEAEMLAYMERLWADRLQGHRLVANRSIWRRFPIIRNERWSHENVVLLGDALHTAHFSIGAGTKLAMEDAIALHDAFRAETSVPDALARFEATRRDEVERTQHSADTSVVWTENPRRYWGMDPIQGAFSMLTRSKAVTYENLRLRDSAFIDRVDAWFAANAGREVAAPKESRMLVVETSRPTPTPPPMFAPFRLRDLVLANRVVVSPMDMYSAVDGTPGDFHFVHFGSLAFGGAGLIVSEMTCVSPEARITPGCAGVYAPEHVVAWKRIIDFVHANSAARFCLQIGHAGRKGSTRVAWEGMDKPLPAGNWELIAPSAIPHYPFNQTPREMTRADMDKVVADFERAALMAEEAGADMLELHMAHGYLLSSFITPVANKRVDEYGGSLENRMRFPLEVLDAVRRVWPKAKPISVRISATDWVGEAGVTGPEAVRIARLLKARGCDLVDVSAGQTTPDAKPVYGRMFQTWFSEEVRNEAGIPTIAVGNITTADQVNTILAAGRADLVALARPHLANPHFTLAAAAHYGVAAQRWPVQYESGKEQALRLGPRDRAEIEALRRAARPKSHRREAGREV